MSLIQCKECGKEISDKAKKCPNCGFPVCTENHKTSPTKHKHIIIPVLIFITIISIIFIAISIVLRSNNSHTKYVTKIISADLDNTIQCNKVYYSEKNNGYIVYFVDENNSEDIATINTEKSTIGYESDYENYSLLYLLSDENHKYRYAESMISCGYDPVWKSSLLKGSSDWKLVK